MGEYMENKMDDLITASLHQEDAFYDKMAAHVESLLKEWYLEDGDMTEVMFEDWKKQKTYFSLMRKILHFLFHQPVERFKLPTDDQLIKTALVFNKGKIEPEKLADMVGMTQLVTNRLHENGDIMIPAKTETE